MPLTAPTHALVLISNPAKPALDLTVVSEARRFVYAPSPTRWLQHNVAAEIPFTPVSPLNREGRKAIAEGIRRKIGAKPIDVAVVEQENRRKKLFLADMDSTMIEQECIDELAAELGLKDQISSITAKAMRGEIAFEPALKERVALLAGLKTHMIERVLHQRITLMAGGKTLLATLKVNGVYSALVSGGFTVFTGPIAQQLGFDEHRSNHLNMDNDALTGTVAEPILGQQAKLDTLIELRTRFVLTPEQTMAVGDGANDLAMLQEAGLGVAAHAKPAVAETAHVRIDHGDLTALLFLQGYSQSEFSA